MRQRTDLEQAKTDALKALRAGIRLKHALAADREINRRLPALERAIDDAIAAGEALELTVGGLLDEA